MEGKNRDILVRSKNVDITLWVLLSRNLVSFLFRLGRCAKETFEKPFQADGDSVLSIAQVLAYQIFV